MQIKKISQIVNDHNKSDRKLYCINLDYYGWVITIL